MQHSFDNFLAIAKDYILLLPEPYPPPLLEPPPAELRNSSMYLCCMWPLSLLIARIASSCVSNSTSASPDALPLWSWSKWMLTGTRGLKNCGKKKWMVNTNNKNVMNNHKRKCTKNIFEPVLPLTSKSKLVISDFEFHLKTQTEMQSFSIHICPLRV